METLTLEKAGSILNIVTMLNAKMNSLITELDSNKSQLEFNKKEIQKRLTLEQVDQGIEEKLIQLTKEIMDMKTQRDEKVKLLTDSGWVVPIPQSDSVKGSVTI